MRMILRRITAADAREAAEFLNSRTLVLRWLVAFFQHFGALPDDEEPYWSLWRGDACDDAGLQCVAAHFYQNGTTYVCADAGADLSSIEDLLDEELLPEKLVGDASLLERWRSESPGLEARASEWKEIIVLESPTSAAQPAAPTEFRIATPADLPVLLEYGRLLETEIGAAYASDFESLVEHGLVFVAEAGGCVQGFVRSNFSDGRFVHAGGLYVHPLYRGKGVGALLAAGLAAQSWKDLGARVVLDAYSENRVAVKAYEQAGYSRIGLGLEARFEDGAWEG